MRMASAAIINNNQVNKLNLKDTFKVSIILVTEEKLQAGLSNSKLVDAKC